MIILLRKSTFKLGYTREFQPGSSFKMVTSMAALENGLDPNFTIKFWGYNVR